MLRQSNGETAAFFERPLDNSVRDCPFHPFQRVQLEMTVIRIASLEPRPHQDDGGDGHQSSRCPAQDVQEEAVGLVAHYLTII